MTEVTVAAETLPAPHGWRAWGPGRFASSLRPSVAPRLKRLIDEQQDRSERLIGWFQLAIIGTFAVLFVIAPKQLPVPIWHRFLFWVIGAYLAFTLVRLYLSYRSRLPAWLLAMSVVADMALLILLILSFHVEYSQPPSFSLKAPTLLYVFIFIALRALRFDSTYVVLAGGTAALGWAAVIVYVLTYDTHGDMNPAITRNYVTYLTSNSILLGAEFDKMISILIVTLVLTVAIWRARLLLIKSVSEQAAAGALSRFFAPEIAERIRRTHGEISAGQGQSQQAAIITTDIRGFTRLSTELRPDEVIALLIEYQARLVPIIQRHGGAVDKFIGDGILATFGCVVSSDTYAADALRAAIDIEAAAQQWAAAREAAGLPAVPVGASVTTGRVVFGAIGDESRLEFTVIGDAVNLCAKLDKHSKVERVRALTTGETYDLALAQGFTSQEPLQRRPARLVDGVAERQDIVVIC
jgi:adenylate cyclase